MEKNICQVCGIVYYGPKYDGTCGEDHGPRQELYRRCLAVPPTADGKVDWAAISQLLNQ